MNDEDNVKYLKWWKEVLKEIPGGKKFFKAKSPYELCDAEKYELEIRRDMYEEILGREKWQNFSKYISRPNVYVVNIPSWIIIFPDKSTIVTEHIDEHCIKKYLYTNIDEYWGGYPKTISVDKYSVGNMEGIMQFVNYFNCHLESVMACGCFLWRVVSNDICRSAHSSHYCPYSAFRYQEWTVWKGFPRGPQVKDIDPLTGEKII